MLGRRADNVFGVIVEYKHDLLLMLIVLASVSMATQAKTFNLRAHLGTKTRYNSVLPFTNAPSIHKLPDPPGHQPVYLYLLSRHGTRWPTSKRLRQMMNLDDILQGSKNNNNYQWLNNQSLSNLDTNLAGELHPYGGDEMWSLGQRLRRRFPSLASQAYTSRRFPIVSTQVSRTSESATAFAAGFFPELPLGSSSRDTSNDMLHQEQPRRRRPQSVAIHMAPKRSDPLLRFFDTCPNYAQRLRHLDTWLERWIQSQRASLISSLTERLRPPRELTAFDAEVLWQLCLFESGLNLNLDPDFNSGAGRGNVSVPVTRATKTRSRQANSSERKPDGDSSGVCGLFAREELTFLEWLDDVRLFERQSVADRLNVDIAAPLVKDLITSIASAAGLLHGSISPATERTSARSAARYAGRKLAREALIVAGADGKRWYESGFHSDILGNDEYEDDEEGALGRRREGVGRPGGYGQSRREEIGRGTGIGFGSGNINDDGGPVAKLLFAHCETLVPFVSLLGIVRGDRGSGPNGPSRGARSGGAATGGHSSLKETETTTEKMESFYSTFTSPSSRPSSLSSSSFPSVNDTASRSSWPSSTSSPPSIASTSSRSWEAASTSSCGDTSPPPGWTPPIPRDEDRFFRGARLAPYGSNIFFVLYRSMRAAVPGVTGSSMADYRVRLIYNEQVIPAPGSPAFRESQELSLPTNSVDPSSNVSSSLSSGSLSSSNHSISFSTSNSNSNPSHPSAEFGRRLGGKDAFLVSTTGYSEIEPPSGLSAKARQAVIEMSGGPGSKRDAKWGRSSRGLPRSLRALAAGDEEERGLGRERGSMTTLLEVAEMYDAPLEDFLNAVAAAAGQSLDELCGSGSNHCNSGGNTSVRCSSRDGVYGDLRPEMIHHLASVPAAAAVA